MLVDLRSFGLLMTITASALVIFAGCSEERDAHVRIFSAGKENMIVPGYGIVSCYVGMPVVKLKGNWIQKPDPILEQDDLTNTTAGLIIGRRAGRVTSIYFNYTADELQPFVGETLQGIGASSSIEQAIYVYGQPIEMSVTQGDGGEGVYLNYLHLGIMFKFTNGVLASIGIIKPTSEGDSDYPSDIGDIGDTSKYRAISAGK